MSHEYESEEVRHSNDSRGSEEVNHISRRRRSMSPLEYATGHEVKKLKSPTAELSILEKIASESNRLIFESENRAGNLIDGGGERVEDAPGIDGTPGSTSDSEYVSARETPVIFLQANAKNNVDRLESEEIYSTSHLPERSKKDMPVNTNINGTIVKDDLSLLTNSLSATAEDADAAPILSKAKLKSIGSDDESSVHRSQIDDRSFFGEMYKMLGKTVTESSEKSKEDESHVESRDPIAVCNDNSGSSVLTAASSKGAPAVTYMLPVSAGTDVNCNVNNSDETVDDIYNSEVTELTAEQLANYYMDPDKTTMDEAYINEAGLVVAPDHISTLLVNYGNGLTTDVGDGTALQFAVSDGVFVSDTGAPVQVAYIQDTPVLIGVGADGVLPHLSDAASTLLHVDCGAVSQPEESASIPVSPSVARRYCNEVWRVARLRKKILRLVRTLFPHLRVAVTLSSHSPQVEQLMEQIERAVNSQGKERGKVSLPTSQVVAEGGLLTLQVVLCQTPRECLRHLRSKTVRFLRTLLPLLTIDESKVESQVDFIENLIDLIIKRNQKP